MEFNVYDFFVDASINLEHKLGCAGMVVVERKSQLIKNKWYLVRENSTNNLCEIMAIWMAVYTATNMLYSEQTPFLANIFSDSQINLFGMREWMPKWIMARHDQCLINSSGAVANQEWFESAYHMIIQNRLKLKLFHQRGHVQVENPDSIFKADKLFRASNKQSPHMVGLPVATMSGYNNLVDNESRIIVNELLNDGFTSIPGVVIIGADPVPLSFKYTDEELAEYMMLIKGGLNYPKNFNMEEK